MSDFDDLRSLTDDDDDFSFDDLDDGEIPFDKLGKAIGEEDDDDDEWADTGLSVGTSSGSGGLAIPAPVLELVSSMNSLERMVLSIMLFANVVVIGITLLLLTGRIGG